MDLPPTLPFTISIGGAFFETVLFGAFLSSVYYVFSTLYRSKATTWSRPDLITCGLIVWFLVFISVHWSTTVWRTVTLVRLLVYGPLEPSGVPGLPAALLFLLNQSSWSALLQLISLVLTTLVADSILIFRSALIWNKNFLVAILPAACLAGYFSCAVAAMAITNRVESSPQTLVVLVKLYKGGGVLSLFVNVYCSVVIALRIIRTEQALRTPGASHTTRRSSQILAVLVESAMAYTLFALISLICQFKNYAWTPASLQILPPLIGVAFCAIFVRARNLNHPQTIVRAVTDTTGSRQYGARRYRGHGQSSDAHILNDNLSESTQLGVFKTVEREVTE